MMIPTQLPELNVPLTSRQDLPPIQPVVATPGVPELSQALDSRVALQWVQPAFDNAPSQALNPNAESLTPSTAPTSAAAMLELDAQPDQAGALMIGHWLSDLTASHPEQTVPWPVADGMSILDTTADSSAPILGMLPQAQSPQAQRVLGQMQALFSSLIQSPLFAADRLAQRMQRREIKPSSVVVDPNRSASSSRPDEAAHALWAPDVAALPPEAEAAQQAAMCLTSGQMVWQGQLMAGVPAVIRREDAWRQNPDQPGQLDKGVCLTVQTQLPRMGTLKITASQWGDQRRIVIACQKVQGAALKAQATDLQARLGDADQVSIDWRELPE